MTEPVSVAQTRWPMAVLADPLETLRKNYFKKFAQVSSYSSKIQAWSCDAGAVSGPWPAQLIVGGEIGFCALPRTAVFSDIEQMRSGESSVLFKKFAVSFLFLGTLLRSSSCKIIGMLAWKGEPKARALLNLQFITTIHCNKANVF